MPVDEAKWSPQLAYYHGQKRKRDAVDKAKDQAKYGSIKRFFQPSSTASTPAASTSAASTSAASTSAASSISEVELLTVERNAFQLWQKQHAKKLKGERSKRVSALLMLLNLDLDSAKQAGTRYRCMVDNSNCVAAALGRSKRWADSLRRWRMDWEESRIPLPGPKLARNQSWKSLYSDEGMILAVRKYLLKQGSKFSTTGLCLAMNEALRARNAVHRLEDTPGEGAAAEGATAEGAATEGAAGGTMKITSISTRTAQRWFAQCG